MLRVPGIGEVPISISGDPTRPGPVLHTIRDVGAVTHALCTLAPGQAVGVRGPYGTSWPVRAAEGGDVVIVAGGIGLPPLRPAIYHVLAHPESYGRLVLLYGARTPADLLFTGELDAWRARPGVTVEVTVDSAGRDWHGNVGVVPDLIAPASTAGGVRPGGHGRVRRGPGDHDAVRGAGAARGGRHRRTGCSCPWSVTCSAPRRCAVTASSGRSCSAATGRCSATGRWPAGWGCVSCDRESPRWPSGSSPPATAASSPC